MVLSCTMRPGWQVVERDLRQLCRDTGVPVFVGGCGIQGTEQAMAAIGVTPMGEDLVDGVENVYRRITGEF